MQGKPALLSEAGKEELEYRIPIYRERICRENPCRRCIAFVEEVSPSHRIWNYNCQGKF